MMGRLRQLDKSQYQFILEFCKEPRLITDLEAQLDYSYSAIYWHINHMVKNGNLEKIPERCGMVKRFYYKTLDAENITMGKVIREPKIRTIDREIKKKVYNVASSTRNKPVIKKIEKLTLHDGTELAFKVNSITVVNGFNGYRNHTEKRSSPKVGVGMSKMGMV
jgi:hypothetical protein